MAFSAARVFPRALAEPVSAIDPRPISLHRGRRAYRGAGGADNPRPAGFTSW